MKLNNKGFTFIEILAAIVIIGILMSIAIVGVSRYKDKAKDKDYEALAKSSYNAMEEYVMTHPYQNKASLETLVDNNLLSNRQDPASPDTECTGSVEVEGNAGGSGNLDSGKYTVYLCCATYKKKYTYPGGKVENYTGTDRCSVPDVEPSTPTPGDETITCSAGNYLPKNTLSCAQCLSSYYCLGGTFKKKTNDQGLSPCPNGYKNSALGSSKESSCYMKVPANKYVKKAKDTSPTTCPSGQKRDAHNVNYGSISTCSSKTVTVTFNCNGGTRSSGPASSSYKSDASGQKFTTKCSYEGKKQDGWKKDKNGKTKNYETNSGVSSSFVISYSPKITLYAHWVDETYKCSAGTYLKKASKQCTKCLANYYCSGGSFKYNKDKDQGINKCSTNAVGYAYSNAGSDAINDCYMNVPENKYVKKAKDTTPTTCPSGQKKDAHKVNYGKTSSCSSKSITVTFNCNGGSIASGPSSATYKSDVAGQKFTTKCNNSNVCQEQDGWKRDKNGSTKNYETLSSVSENFVLTYTPKITLYAHWKVKSIKCNAGYYLKKGAITCTKCPAGYYCPEKTYSCSTSGDQGINKCPNCYTNSNAGSSKQSDCYSNVSKNHYVKTATSCSQACPSGQYKDAHKVNYGKVSSCSNKTIQVTFNCNGGSIASGPATATYTSNGTNQKFTTKCNYSNACNGQDGWKRDKNGSSKNYETLSNVTENFVLTYSPKLTLYAHWKVKSTKCNAGYYLKKGATTCTKCESGYYCPGNTFNCSTSADQGRSACPNGYGNSAAGSSNNTQCYMNVPTNNYVKTARASSYTACVTGQNRAAHTVYYGGTSSCNWTTYTITYNLNGGSVSGNPSSYKANTETITLKNPTRNGYTFTGWTGSNGSTPSKSVKIPKGSTGNKTYTANWAVANVTVTVTFKPNGASGSDVVRDCTYKANATNKNCSITSPGISRSGWNIVGWGTGSGSTSSSWGVNTAKTVSSNATYYAVTYKSITANFNYKMDDYHNINVLKDASRNTTKSCNLYNTNSSCNVTSPGVSFGKSNHKKGNQFDLNKYFNCKWGSTTVGQSMSITSGATYKINCTANTASHGTITALSEKGVNEVCTRNDKSKLYTYGISKQTKYGHIDDYHKMKWDGEWLIDSKNHLLWLHGKTVQKETICIKVKDSKFCKTSKKDYATCYMSARLSYIG